MKEIDQSIRRYQRLGLAAMLLCVGGAAAWAASVQLSGAIVATGTVVVETSVKKIQHGSGGLVGEILVKEGTKVQPGRHSGETRPDTGAGKPANSQSAD